MSSLVLSIPSAPAASNASSASASASSTARGRDAQSPTDAEGFGAALTRTREARARQAEDSAQPASDGPAARRRGPASAAQREDASPADLLAMAMLTPAFAMQAMKPQGASAQDGDAATRSLLGGAATADDALASSDAPAPKTDARSPAQSAGAAADTAAAQAAQASATEQQDKDAKSAKAKADALPTGDAKPLAAAMPGAAAAQPQDNPAAAASNAPKGAIPASGASARAEADTAALPQLSIREATSADHQTESQADSPTLPPGAFSFKAALAEAANASPAAQTQATPRFNVPTPVGAEGWGSDIGTQMIRMGTDGHHVAELSLNPAGLGPLKVTLTLGDNQAQAMFVSAHESVRRALEAALPQLRDTLAGQGIQLGQASVDAGTQQQQAFGQERGSETPARPGSRGAQQATAIETEPARTANRSRASSGIDTFA